MTRYAYLHGFASSPLSKKGVRMAEDFRQRGVDLERPDLNEPSFAELTYSGALTAIDALHAEHPDTWCLVGSSLGGYLAALWASLHPELVERLVLLCPGFELVHRWPDMLGQETMTRWKQEGTLELPDATGTPTPLWWKFIEDATTHPAVPDVSCPTLIIHGRADETVPIAGSRRYAATHKNVELIEVEDDHRLLASTDLITTRALEFFSIR